MWFLFHEGNSNVWCMILIPILYKFEIISNTSWLYSFVANCSISDNGNITASFALVHLFWKHIITDHDLCFAISFSTLYQQHLRIVVPARIPLSFRSLQHLLRSRSMVNRCSNVSSKIRKKGKLLYIYTEPSTPWFSPAVR